MARRLELHERRNLDWAPILERALEVAEALTVEIGAPPTLRSIHYRLFGVPEGHPDHLRYGPGDYSQLCTRTTSLSGRPRIRLVPRRLSRQVS